MGDSGHGGLSHPMPHPTSNRTKSQMNFIGRQTTAGSCRWGAVAALVLSVGVAGCDGLLEVNLPAAVTSDAVNDASVAPILVNTVMAQFECGYSTFAMDAAGQEDNFQMVTGVAGNYSQYTATPGGGQCDGGNTYSQSWLDPFLIARAQGADTYNKMVNDWGTSQQLVARVAFYEAAILDIFGEHFCEFAQDAGPLMTPVNTLDSAEAWVNRVLAITGGATGDFAVTTTAGTQTTSLQTAAYGLRARIRWARRGAGDLALAAADAALVPDNHVTWVLREEGEGRRNMISTSQSGGGGVQAAGFLQGPVKLKTATNTYGITLLGSHPNGTPWPNPLPFTGYIDLGIETATGRAVYDTSYPVLETDAGAEDDSRVAHAVRNTAGGPLETPSRYPNQADDIPLISWKEMRLIRAEAAGPSAAGVDHVNVLRTAAGLPLIQGAYRTLVEDDAARYRDMLIEETRRALFEEARFWSRKIIHNDLLWFPRAEGDLINAGASYVFGGGVRQLFDGTEYQVNPNFVAGGGQALRGTGCAPFEAPVFN